MDMFLLHEYILHMWSSVFVLVSHIVCVWCTSASFRSQQTNTHRYLLDTVTSRSTSADKTDHSIHLWVSAPSAPFICGWVDQAEQHFSHCWPVMHLGLWRNVTGLNALICHETQAATPLYTHNDVRTCTWTRMCTHKHAHKFYTRWSIDLQAMYSKYRFFEFMHIV